MIARYKKKTLLSRCDFVYVQMIWLLFYSMIASIVFLAVLDGEVNFFKFINSQWEITGKQFIWSTTIPNNLRLLVQKGTTNVGKTNI